MARDLLAGQLHSAHKSSHQLGFPMLYHGCLGFELLGAFGASKKFVRITSVGLLSLYMLQTVPTNHPVR